MTEVVFLRHFQTRVEPDVPAAEWELSADGEAAEEEWLDATDLNRFAAVVSSPEPKALHTAEQIADRPGLDVTVLDGLAEVDRSGEGFVNDHETYLAMARTWLDGDADFDWEPHGAVQDRTRDVLDRLAEMEGPVLAVTHGLWMAALRAWVEDVEPYPLWQEMSFGETWTVDTGDIDL